ncbi:MAG: glycoside hydrolase family 3 N-terminal domain-containing protein, partial [Mycobacteriales bacterium]
DPAGWTDRQLALRLVMAGYDMSRTDAALPWVRDGLGGVLLFGRPPGDLGGRLSRLRSAGVLAPLVASDEEGGQVQRLAPLLPRLPSAATLARTRTPAQARALAVSYGRQMRALGVDTSLAPVADLAIPGQYIAGTNRAFSADPATVAAYAGAWQEGLSEAGVLPVAKHWPGHGEAANTHGRPASTPPLSTLERRDLLPFSALLQAGVPAVMVGHLTVPGLTEPGLPATLSPQAYGYLRARAGTDRLLLTDSVSMGAVTSGLGLTPAQAAVRALRAGADMVLVDTGPGPLVDAISQALADGSYARTAAVASARRVLAVRQAPAPAPAGPPPAQPPPAQPPPSSPPMPPPPPAQESPSLPAPPDVVPAPRESSAPTSVPTSHGEPVGLGPPRSLRIEDLCDCGVGSATGARRTGVPGRSRDRL